MEDASELESPQRDRHAQRFFRSIPTMLASDNVTAKAPGTIVAAWDHYRGAVASAAALSLFVNLLMLASPLFMLQVYDRVLTSRSLPTLVVLLTAVGGAFVVAALLDGIRSRLMARIAAGFSQQLGQATFSAVVEHSLQRRPGVHAQPLRDLESLRQYLAGSGPAAFFDMPWVPIYLLFAYLLHPLLGLMTVVAAAILFCLAYLNERLTGQAELKVSRQAQRSLALVEDAYQGAEVLRAMGMERRFRDRWTAANQGAQTQQLQNADRTNGFSTASRMLRLFLQSAILGLGAALAIDGQVSAGTIIAASIIMSRALAPVEQATAQWGQLQGALRALGRLRMALAEGTSKHEPMPLPAPRGRLDVEGLMIAAPGSRQPFLTGVNFALEPGEALGIVGPSGSGKSTLVRALVRVWPQLAGTIRLDGAQLDHWPAAQFGDAIGYVPQDVELFAGTVADNIARFDPAADSAAVVRAAQRANVHEMILRLPQGYATELGESGLKLSAGQRQRVALARALYGKPVLLVLDEPNSNLDGAGEAALARTLAELRREGVTVIAVTHRPSSLQLMTKILCLNDGRQAAFGPREEIFAKSQIRQAGPTVTTLSGKLAS